MPPTPPPQKPIIVWIHGTKPSSFLPIQLSQRLEDKMDKFALIPTGLHHIDTLDWQNRIYALHNALKTSEQFPDHTLYGFGWCGSLAPGARRKAGQNLYQSLKELIAQHKSHYNQAPPITIITHSHGGNVALYLADCAAQEDDLAIDRLILLACPVQEHTKHNINHPLFEKIYSIHSHWDMIQIADPQGLHPWQDALHTFLEKPSFVELKLAYQSSFLYPQISERHFPDNPKLKQVSVRWEKTTPWSEEDTDSFGNIGSLIKAATKQFKLNARGVLHTEFIIPSFFCQLPFILSVADQDTQSKHELTIGI